MSIQPYDIRRLRAAEESTFGADLTGTISAFDPIRITGLGTLSLINPRESPNTMQQVMDSNPYDVLTEQKSAALTFTMNITGAASRAGNNTTHTQCAFGRILRCWLGSQRLGQGDLVAAGSATNTVNVDTGARWEAGAAIAFLDPDGRLVAERIASVATNALTVYPDVAAGDLPADNATAYAAQSYYLGPPAQDDSENKTLQFLAEGQMDDDRFVLLGGKVTTIALSFTNGGIATATVTVEFADWMYGADAATDITGAFAYDSEAINGSPLAVHDSVAVWTEGDSADPITIHTSKLEITCSPAWTKIPSTSGVNGVIGWARAQRLGIVTTKFRAPFEDLTWFERRDASGAASSGLLTFQLGSSATYGSCFFFAYVQVQDVQVVNENGLTYQEVTCRGGIQLSSTSETHINDAPFAIHLF